MTEPKIKYDIEANVSGDASVEQLETHLRELGKVLDGDLKNKAIAAADALRSLGDKQNAITNFHELTNATRSLEMELKEATYTTQQIENQLKQATSSTQNFARTEMATASALQDTKNKLATAKQAHLELQASVTGSARKTADYKEQIYQFGTWLNESFATVRKFGVAVVGYCELWLNTLKFLKEAATALFTSDTVGAAFDRYKKANTESIAILTDMMDAAEKAPEKIGAATTDASTKTEALGATAKNTGAQIANAGSAGSAGLAKVGETAEGATLALSKLFESAQATPSSNKGVGALVLSLQEARTAGADLDQVLRDNLPEAISKLQGEELMKFRNHFMTAFNDSTKDSKALETGLRLIGEQAAKSLGVDLIEASSKAGAAFTKANADMAVLIRSLPVLKEAGVDTGRVLQEALSKMIDGAKNKAELDAINQRLESLRQTLGSTVTDGLLKQSADQAQKLKEKLDDITPGINSVAEAMKKLGITSDASLKETASTFKECYDKMVESGTASARELSEAFKKSAEAAIAANNGIAPSWVTAQAAARGYVVQVDEAGKTTLKTTAEMQKELQKTKDGWNDAGKSAKNYGDAAVLALERQNAAQKRVNAAIEEAAELERKRRGIDKDGFTVDSSGGRQIMGGEWTTWMGIMNMLKAHGIKDEKAANEIAKKFVDDKGNYIWGGVNGQVNPGQREYGGQYGTASFAIMKAAEEYLRQQVENPSNNNSSHRQNTPQSSTSNSTSNQSTSTSTQSSATSSAKTMRIEIVSGKNTPIEVTSDKENAQRLLSLLKQQASTSSI